MKRLSKIMCAVVAASGLAAAPSIAATTYVGAKVGMGWLDSACVAGAKCDDDAIGAVSTLATILTRSLALS